MDNNNRRFTIYQQISTVGGKTLQFFAVGSAHYLVVGQQNKLAVYVWDFEAQIFSALQEIPAVDVYNIHIFTSSNGISELLLFRSFFFVFQRQLLTVSLWPVQQFFVAHIFQFIWLSQ